MWQPKIDLFIGAFWQDLWDTVRGNRIRTCLTLLGVFWGIFLLVILQGAGVGLEEGIRGAYGGRSLRSGILYGYPTTLAYSGFTPGRNFSFNNRDTDALKASVPGLEYLAPRQHFEARRGSSSIERAGKAGNFHLNGETTDYFHCVEVKCLSGRLLNEFDIRENRKVAVIGTDVKNVLFGEEDPIGKDILVMGSHFLVVGVFESFNSGAFAQRDARSVYMPLKTLQRLCQLEDSVLWYWFTVKPGYSVAEVGKSIGNLLKKRHQVHPLDHAALFFGDNEADYLKYARMLKGIHWMVLFVGLGTLFTGSIGVSNIMLIVVKERVAEIGIRKALGATPYSIVSMILHEAIVFTSFAGLAGIVVGFWVLEALRYYLDHYSNKTGGLFANPHIEWGTAFAALAVIVVSGCLAGWIPARRAAAIRPAEALMTAI